MGLRKESIYLLMQEGLKQPFRGKITTLGKQDVWLTYGELEQLARKINYPLRPAGASCFLRKLRYVEPAPGISC